MSNNEMLRNGATDLYVVVWSDWSSIISQAGKNRDVFTEDQYEALLDQKPYDEDDAEYARYLIKCENSNQLLNMCQNLRDAGFTSEIAMHFKTEGVDIWSQTGDGYDRKSKPTTHARISIPNNKYVDAISNAVVILQESIR